MLLDISPCMLFVWSDVWPEERPLTLCESYYLPIISQDLSLDGKPCSWGKGGGETNVVQDFPLVMIQVAP